MKVLMFGWEFPPHISGGLGTACHGLTRALGKEDVTTLFVVPTLHGGESLEKGTLINASQVVIRSSEEENIIPESDVPSLPKVEEQIAMTAIEKTAMNTYQTVSEVIENTLLRLEVPSTLIPYHAMGS